jgi:recombination associated protein RdgC
VDKEDSRKQNSLGKDFLTYICYKSDKHAGLVEIPGVKKQFSLWIDQKIIMEDDRSTLPNTVSYTGDNFTNQDLKQAIRSGKKVREVRFRIEAGENTWAFNLRADRFEISGLKMDLPRTDDIEQRFLDRMLNIDKLNSLIDALYEHFIREVYGKTWKTKGYREFQKWLTTI